jgi:hypothetical protein
MHFWKISTFDHACCTVSIKVGNSYFPEKWCHLLNDSSLLPFFFIGCHHFSSIEDARLLGAHDGVTRVKSFLGTML